MRKFLFSICSFFVFLQLLIFPNKSSCSDITTNVRGSLKSIVIEGEIESGDYERFLENVRKGQGKICLVYVYSPGGDYIEAIKIGRAIRKLELETVAPWQNLKGVIEFSDWTPRPKETKNSTCGSAGFFVFLGGIHKSGNVLIVHRPIFQKKAFGSLSESEAKVAFELLQKDCRDYMTEMGVTKKIQDEVLNTPSDKGISLDQATIKAHLSGYLPFRDEWLKAKCTVLKDSERARFEELSNRLVKTQNPDSLNSFEWKEYNRLSKMDKEEMKKKLETLSKARELAYEKFFGTQADDTGSHEFSKWISAEKYVGGDIGVIISEERFEKNTIIKGFYSREATAVGPAITLSESEIKKGIVGSVCVLSGGKPSPKFIEKVVQTLESAWGKTTGGDRNKTWSWKRNKIRGELRLEPKSAEGEFLALTISKEGL